MTDQENTQNRETEESFINSLKWYFSPYLTTLVTGPIFLILVYFGIIFIWQLITTIFSGDLFSGFLGPSIFSLPIISAINLAIIWNVFHKLPKVWREKTRSTGTRIFIIIILFIGSIVGVTILDFVRSYFIGLSR
jgi:hypothetical protein